MREPDSNRSIVQLLASKRRRVYQTNGVDKTDLRISIVTSLPSSPASDLLHPRFSRPKFPPKLYEFLSPTVYSD
ncbi:hypothetical protein L2E82_32573 [Cichorium intybus]|uniref:Uncharacterized protein n=1 Tax=Cichorium intybus TaxID=13427 RepID=A0ACB9BHK1_CICIN|nr:hypothetical protein L2E82_32573 [Cichorium intybus]